MVEFYSVVGWIAGSLSLSLYLRILYTAHIGSLAGSSIYYSYILSYRFCNDRSSIWLDDTCMCSCVRHIYKRCSVACDSLQSSFWRPFGQNILQLSDLIFLGAKLVIRCINWRFVSAIDPNRRSILMGDSMYVHHKSVSRLGKKNNKIEQGQVSR